MRVVAEQVATSLHAAGGTLSVGEIPDVSADPGLLEVEGNGRGIRASDTTRIFEIFERADAPEPHTGVGLAIVRRAMERLGGRVWVESDGHTGSKFSLWLPSLPEPLSP